MVGVIAFIFQRKKQKLREFKQVFIYMGNKTEIQCLPGPVPRLDYMPVTMSLPPALVAQLLGGTERDKGNHHDSRNFLRTAIPSFALGPPTKHMRHPFSSPPPLAPTLHLKRSETWARWVECLPQACMRT